MNATPTIPEAVSLPEILPLFPLTGALLLPHGHFPLNIFEPRYLNMVADAMAGTVAGAECGDGGGARMIGIIQPVHAEPDPVSERAKVFNVGCAGRVTSFRETEDGRYLIVLQGVCRFDVVRELELDSKRGYRRAAVNYDDFMDDLVDEAGTLDDRPRLLKAVNEFFGFRKLSPDWQAIEETDDATLVSSLAMICPFEVPEKQGLLECADMACRETLLTSLLEMGAHPGGVSSFH